MSGKAPAVCGTISGRQRHIRHGEPLCTPCAVAYKAYLDQWRKNARVIATPGARTDGVSPRTAAALLGKRPDLGDLAWFGVRAASGFMESA